MNNELVDKDFYHRVKTDNSAISLSYYEDGKAWLAMHQNIPGGQASISIVLNEQQLLQLGDLVSAAIANIFPREF